MKRGLFDFWDSDSETTTTEAPDPRAPTTSGPLDEFLGLFRNDEEATTPKDDRYHQSDESPEDETTNQEDLDMDLTDGSGSNRDYEPTDEKSPYCELRVFIFFPIVSIHWIDHSIPLQFSSADIQAQ